MNPPPGNVADSQSEEKRMIGDFDGSAHTLWALYGREARSHDKAQIQTLKEDMDGVLIFVRPYVVHADGFGHADSCTQAGLFSTVLTSFIIDSKQSLKVDPADQMVYYLQQNVAVLDQISRQISSIAPQVSINSTLPFPAFKPLPSNIRINVFWFMALVFSLAAALLAILVQQWVRDYIHVFQRYSDPLKSARLRQYLHEGSERWYMPVVAEAVPGLLHVSLFLFLVGLCDFILNINIAVGLSTALPIALTGLLYTFTTFAPVIYPQSPYQNPFSGLIWYLIQKFGRGREYKDRGSNGTSKSVSPNMAQGQMQLAMEESGERKGRDERAIRWLIDIMTEDPEMESFVMAIPGSFNGEWGKEVWKKISSTMDDENKSRGQNEPILAPPGPPMDTNFPTIIPPVVRPSFSRASWSVLDPIIRLVNTRTTSDSHTNTMALLPTPLLAHVQPHSSSARIQEEDVMRELTARVARLLVTCRNRGLFASDELWRRRTRGCVETTASLVFCAGAELGQFGDVAKLLGDIGSDQRMRESSRVGKDQLFVVRWTCLSLVAVRPILESDLSLRDNARQALTVLEEMDDNDTGVEPSPIHHTRFEKIIETFDKVSRCLMELSDALRWEENLTEEKAKEILHKHESQIELEHIHIQNDSLQSIDWSIRAVQRHIDRSTHGIITRQLPGLKFDDSDSSSEPVHFSQLIEIFRDFHTFRFTFPVQNLQRVCSITHTFRNILQGQWDVNAFKEALKNLQEFVLLAEQHENALHRQAWRLQDLRDGGGLGFTVELFFVALKQLFSTTSSAEPHAALFIATFRAIISDWSEYKKCVGTQKLLLDLFASYLSDSDSDYPAYIINEFLELLGNVLEGQKGQHIDDAVQHLTHEISLLSDSSYHRPLFVKALGVITRSRSSSL